MQLNLNLLDIITNEHNTTCIMNYSYFSAEQLNAAAYVKQFLFKSIPE